MSRFARDCVRKMSMLTRKLEVRLGPDTADLKIRVGLHSGPVTAGVLRGDKSRFQLFGDVSSICVRRALKFEDLSADVAFLTFTCIRQ